MGKKDGLTRKDRSSQQLQIEYLSQTIATMQHKNTGPNLDRFIGILGLSACLLVFALQSNGVEMNWEVSVASYTVIASVCVWSCLRHAVPHLGKIGKRLTALGVFGLVFILGGIGTYKQYRREHPKISIARIEEKRITLEELFKSDFPNVHKLTSTLDPTVFEDGERVVVTMQLYADFPAKIDYMGYYIPVTVKTPRVCIRLANSIKQNQQSLMKHVEAEMLFPSTPVSLKDLVFSGRVFIYHEYPMTIAEKAEIIQYFKSQGLSVEFLGIEYLQSEILKRRVQKQSN